MEVDLTYCRLVVVPRYPSFGDPCDHAESWIDIKHKFSWLIFTDLNTFNVDALRIALFLGRRCLKCVLHPLLMLTQLRQSEVMF